MFWKIQDKKTNKEGKKKQTADRKNIVSKQAQNFKCKQYKCLNERERKWDKLVKRVIIEK